ncbi:MerR family transcriptional regulator [Herbivorax sp. ANBcel31]|uniref:MerR family transcriptional regulator n=1 Tax=Herbivorax sp. ANBcel31 TaxID=3069754 RepID=UPI0027B335A9|nr:MerR family transcriptional regulator [Herbivorax sp. ANBcel31]MDQ2087748.1 MerR family transcriptional regulator [Herbivorax sp. ANBcel31]
MLSIGEFSKICRVSTKTLRYYDEIGLIKPDEINTETGYRYYSIKQLKKMLYIDRLKSYHFSLEEIKDIMKLDKRQSEEVLYSKFKSKKIKMEEKLKCLEYSIKQINSDISNLQNDIPIMSYLDNIDVELVETEPMNILYLRKIMSKEDFFEGYGSYFGRLYERIALEKLTPLGRPMTIYHNTEFNPDGNDTEFAIPIKEVVDGTRILPGGICAKSVLKGSYIELSSLYIKLSEWIEQKGYELTKSPYEIYTVNPNQVNTSDNLVTEVFFSIKKK